MPIVPDDKDWTWVLSRRCAECGYDASSVSFRDLPDLVLLNAAAWPALLEQPAVAERPDESTWSTLEYAAHVRDVCRVMLERLTMMLEKDHPEFPNWDQDETAIVENYGAQDPATVAQELLDAAAAASAGFSAVDASQVDRGGVRSNGSEFTVVTLGGYFLHDLVHHLHDVRRDHPSAS